jgi:hypothetical protein
MAPINFEEHIKKQLSDREIKPSENAWSKISKDIETNNSKNKKGVFWYAIAASLISLFVVLVYFFKHQGESIMNTNPVVEENKTEIIEGNNKSNETLQKDISTENTVATLDNEKNTPVSNTVQNSKILLIEKDKALNVVNEQSNTLTTLANNLTEKELVIQYKINDLVAKVDSLELNNIAITDAEVDSLLRRAQNEILEQKIFKNNNSVDAMALLNEAENELDASFRDQLFDKLKNGYLKVKTALADRNN